MNKKDRARRRTDRICFVVSPIGDEGSETRRISDYVLRNIIRPALAPLRFRFAKRIDQLNPLGRIDDRILDHVEQANLVVVDLTGLNPNVMFEMGIRQAWNLPLIPVAPSNLKLPFDVSGINTIKYPPLESKGKLSQAQLAAARTKIQAQARQALKNHAKDTPFSRAMVRFGNRFSLDAVYRAKEKTLDHLRSDLCDVLAELRADPGFKKSKAGGKALRQFSASAGRLFSSLRSKVHVLKFVAEGEGSGPEVNSAHCLEICKKMESLQKRGDRLLAFIGKAGNRKTNLGTTETQVEGILHAIRDIEKLIKKRVH